MQTPIYNTRGVRLNPLKQCIHATPELEHALNDLNCGNLFARGSASWLGLKYTSPPRYIFNVLTKITWETMQKEGGGLRARDLNAAVGRLKGEAGDLQG